MHATRGIVLNHIKYKETSIVVQVYTELFGRQGYLVNNVRSAKNKGAAILLQPMTLLDLQVYHRPKADLQRIKEFKICHPLQSIPFDQNKRAVSFFLTEILSKVLREEEHNSELFNFIFQSIELYDAGIDGQHNFHLFFLFQLTKFLGFSAAQPHPENLIFDLMNGLFVSAVPSHGYGLQGEAFARWKLLYDLRIEGLDALKLSSFHRNALLDDLLLYYALHLDGMQRLKSLAIIRQLFE